MPAADVTVVAENTLKQLVQHARANETRAVQVWLGICMPAYVRPGT